MTVLPGLPGHDKPYRDCMAEIIGVLKKYDMAGAVPYWVHRTRGHAMPTLYEVKYQMPGQPVRTERGLTEDGVRLLQRAVMLGGGWGSSQTMEQARDGRRMVRQIRGEARAVRGRHYARMLGVSP